MWHLVRCVVSESQVHSHWGTHGWNHCHVSLKMCCSYLWCKMSSLSANKKTHGCVICNNEYTFGVCIEMEWVWVTMTNSSKWSWPKCLLLMSCDEFFCTLLVKSIGVLQFSVSLLSALMAHYQHCINTKTSNGDKCVCVFKNVCHIFSFWVFSWQPFITHHHIHQTNTPQHDFTHIHLSFLHKCHIFHKKQTAEMLVKWEGCTWWFH